VAESTTKGSGVRKLDELVTPDDQQNNANGTGKHEKKQFFTMSSMTSYHWQ
jgi:hypothetical protein